LPPLLKALTATTPLILVLDDVHAADEASLLDARSGRQTFAGDEGAPGHTYREAEARFAPTLT